MFACRRTKRILEKVEPADDFNITHPKNRFISIISIYPACQSVFLSNCHRQKSSYQTTRRQAHASAQSRNQRSSTTQKEYLSQGISIRQSPPGVGRKTP